MKKSRFTDSQILNAIINRPTVVASGCSTQSMVSTAKRWASRSTSPCRRSGSSVR